MLFYLAMIFLKTAYNYYHIIATEKILYYYSIFPRHWVISQLVFGYKQGLKSLPSIQSFDTKFQFYREILIPLVELSHRQYTRFPALAGRSISLLLLLLNPLQPPLFPLLLVGWKLKNGKRCGCCGWRCSRKDARTLLRSSASLSGGWSFLLLLLLLLLLPDSSVAPTLLAQARFQIQKQCLRLLKAKKRIEFQKCVLVCSQHGLTMLHLL